MRQLIITRQITNRSDASLDKYLQDISKEELINGEKEVELAQQIKLGNKKALEKLIRANLRFVVSVAKQYQNQGLTLSDLINDGNIGLIKAAERFDETKGFKFISYAVWWIRQTILHALSEQARMVRLPSNRIIAINKIYKTSSKLEQELEREPSTEEIAHALELAPEDIKQFMRNSSRHVSMDAPLNNSDEESNTLFELMQGKKETEPDNGLLNESLRKEIERALSSLSIKEADVINKYYGLNGNASHTLDEIGRKYNLTRERVRQIKDKAIRRLKHTSRNKLLKTFLG